MDQRSKNEKLKSEIKRNNFTRAAYIAASLDLSEDKLRDIQFDALWQMAALNRNALGTKTLAQKYGVSKQELKKYLQERAKQLRENGHTKALAARYDMITGKYLTFEEWVKFYTEIWKNYK